MPFASQRCSKTQKILFTGRRIQRILSQRIPLHQVGVRIQRGLVGALQFLLGKKEISQHHVAESLDRCAKLLVGVVFRRQRRNLCFQLGINGLARGFSLGQFFRERANRRGGLVRLVKGDVEAHHLRAVFAQNVQHGGEVRPRKRPLAQPLLRFLIDVDNYDAGIRRTIFRGPQPEARIQRIQLQPLDKNEQGTGMFADVGENVQAQRGDGDDQADQERNAVLPPGLQQLEYNCKF